MNIKYCVDLSQEEREELEGLLRGGQIAARKLKRAQILLAADSGIGDETMASTLQVSGSTIYRTKRRFVEANLEGALSDEPRPGAERKLRQTGGALGGDRLFEPAAGTRSLDARTPGRRDGQAHRP